MIGVLEQPCIAGLARQTSATGQQKTRHARKHAGFRRAFSDCAGLPCGAPGKHFDSLGLYLELTPAGGRYWRMKYAIAGEELGLAAAEARATLAPLVSRLGERDRHVLRLRFFEGLTQSEIAADIGVTQMQVSRLLARILRDLRRGHDDGPTKMPAARSA